MSGTTTRLQLPYPGLTDGPDGADVPYWLQQLADALDGAALYSQGILANRPASTPSTPGVPGRFYYIEGDSNPANDGVLWVDFGTGWAEASTGGTIIDLLQNRPAGNTVIAGRKFFATDQIAEYVSDGTQWIRVTEPAGVVTICLAATADPGRILLQGQAWPGTGGIYADLYAKLGGATLPDFTGLVPVGFKTSDPDFGTLLATGGEKKHTLSVGEIPAHAHTINPPQNSGSDNGPISAIAGWANETGPAVQSTSSVGGGLAHDNLQPFIVVNFQAKL